MKRSYGVDQYSDADLVECISFAHLGTKCEWRCAVTLPVHVVPVQALGDEFALLPVRLQLSVAFTTSNAEWSVAQDLHQQKGNSASYMCQSTR